MFSASLRLPTATMCFWRLCERCVLDNRDGDFGERLSRSPKQGRGYLPCGHFLRHMNQSRHLTSGSAFSIRSFAAPHDPGEGTITSSPSCQLAGVAI